MSDALVIASHLPGEGHFESERFNVRGVECSDPYDYWRGFAEHWESDLTLIGVEHDIEVTDEHIAALIDCPHDLCSHAYRCHWYTTHIPGGVIAAGTGARDLAKPVDAYYLQGGEEWARWSAIGLVKITAEARVGPLRREPWNFLELAIEDAVTGPWHMHWPPVPHHHW